MPPHGDEPARWRQRTDSHCQVLRHLHDIAPNHKGMPALTPAEEQNHLRRQVLTSRNVRGGRIVDLLLGGLNYQVEHHLFPSMPRPNLRRAQRLVAAFRAQRGVRYVETCLLDSYRQVLQHLHDIPQPATIPEGLPG